MAIAAVELGAGWGAMSLVALEARTVVRTPLIRLVAIQADGSKSLELMLLMTRCALLVWFDGGF